MTTDLTTSSDGGGGRYRIQQVDGPVEHPDRGSPEPTGDMVIRRHGDVAEVQIDDEVVIYSSSARTSLVLDATAHLLWQCLDGTSSLHEIFIDIADAYGVADTQITDDFLPVAGRWLAAEVVEVVNND